MPFRNAMCEDYHMPWTQDWTLLTDELDFQDPADWIVGHYIQDSYMWQDSPPQPQSTLVSELDNSQDMQNLQQWCTSYEDNHCGDIEDNTAPLQAEILNVLAANLLQAIPLDSDLIQAPSPLSSPTSSEVAELAHEARASSKRPRQSEGTSDSAAALRAFKKIAHSHVERRYRETITTRMSQLHQTLRIAKAQGTNTKGEEENGNRKVRKVDVIFDAITYIKEAEAMRMRVNEEVKFLRARVKFSSQLGFGSRRALAISTGAGQ